MANRKVSLVRYCKTDGGWRRLPVVLGKNGRVRPGFVLVNGEAVANDTGHFELRFYKGAKLTYLNVGTNAADALAACQRQAKLLAVKDTADAIGVKMIEETGRKRLQSALASFVEAAEARGSRVAAKVYRTAGEAFLASTGRQFVDQLTAEDVATFHKHLRSGGLSPRTISNRHKLVMAFLRDAGADASVFPKSAPKYDSVLPTVYSTEQTSLFFASLTSDYHRVVFSLALQCGLREQELMHVCWSDVTLSSSRPTLTVRSKPQWGFVVKTKEERSIPLSSSLVEQLTAYRKAHPGGQLVTGTSGDLPNRKLLRTLKRLVHHAGLGCRVCAACLERNECEEWYLHKFRATFCTRLLQSGWDLRTVMQLSGHRDIESVMRYLRPAEGEELQAKVNALQWT